MNKEEELIDRLIDLAFAEDIGDGDHTTLPAFLLRQWASQTADKRTGHTGRYRDSQGGVPSFRPLP